MPGKKIGFFPVTSWLSTLLTRVWDFFRFLPDSVTFLHYDFSRSFVNTTVFRCKLQRAARHQGELYMAGALPIWER